MNEIRKIGDLTPDDRNANKHTERGMGMLEDSLRSYGAGRSVLLDRDGRIIAGNATIETAADIGMEDVVVVPTDGTQIVAVMRTDLSLDDPKARELALLDNRVAEQNLSWDTEMLLGLESEGVNVGAAFSGDELTALVDAAKVADTAEARGRDIEAARKTLAERFGVPPFSVLDSRQGYWQERKNAWLALGLRSYEGRENALIYDKSAKPPAFYELKNQLRAQWKREPSWDEVNAEAEKRGMMSAAIQGTSIFDPVLAELCYRWFCPAGGVVLDPFAGGSVRGVVAAKLGRRYCGVDLRPEQVDANGANWREFVAQFEEELPAPSWVCGDSAQLSTLPGIVEQADFVLSCPPYADLEQYSDDPLDLSNMPYSQFVEAYRVIVASAVARLKPDRFACFVVGEVREPKGYYRNFVSDTVAAFENAGARHYNEAVFVTQAASLAIRAGRMLTASRKLGKQHQNVLVSVKGDWKKAVEACGECEWGDLGEATEKAINE